MVNMLTVSFSMMLPTVATAELSKVSIDSWRYRPRSVRIIPDSNGCAANVEGAKTGTVCVEGFVVESDELLYRRSDTLDLRWASPDVLAISLKSATSIH